MIKKIFQRIKDKKSERASKWLDTYGVADMTMEYVVKNKTSLKRRAIGKIVYGILLILAVFVLIILFWDKIFYSYSGWL